MEILIFVVVLVVLIVVHEFGHFVVAKWSGMRVDEFGLGYPPRALLIAKIGETEYTLNWLPFGGFVKIYGEDGQNPDTAQSSRAFSQRPRILQALVLIAGITMNILLAYVLITGALIVGTPRALTPAELPTAHDRQLAVADVLPGSPASHAGILPGDSIIRAQDTQGTWQAFDPQSFSTFVAASTGEPIDLSVERNGGTLALEATPEQGVVSDDPTRYALGVDVATIGVLPLSFTTAMMQGASLTWGALTITASGLLHFFYTIFTFSANLSEVSGPVGIATAVGSASTQGIGALLSLVAIISINLALINLIPIPALDGGRLAFVLLEAIFRRPIPVRVAQTVNTVGFVFLILLMVVVTTHDIIKLVG
jgi:regulator of sigma E protease